MAGPIEGLTKPQGFVQATPAAPLTSVGAAAMPLEHQQEGASGEGQEKSSWWPLLLSQTRAVLCLKKIIWVLVFWRKPKFD